MTNKVFVGAAISDASCRDSTLRDWDFFLAQKVKHATHAKLTLNTSRTTLIPSTFTARPRPSFSYRRYYYHRYRILSFSLDDNRNILSIDSLAHLPLSPRFFIVRPVIKHLCTNLATQLSSSTSTLLQPVPAKFITDHRRYTVPQPDLMHGDLNTSAAST